MKILIVDDHPLVTAGLYSALKAKYCESEIVTASDLSSARARIAETIFDLAIVDINLPDGRGGQLFSDPALAGRYPRHSLLLSGSQDRDDILNALNLGAAAFIPKTVEFNELLAAIDALLALDVAKAPYWYDCGLKKFVFARDLFPRGTALSAREHEIYDLIRSGLTDKQIAFQLGRSVHTVRVQIRSIRRKRGETRRAASQAA